MLLTKIDRVPSVTELCGCLNNSTRSSVCDISIIKISVICAATKHYNFMKCSSYIYRTCVLTQSHERIRTRVVVKQDRTRAEWQTDRAAGIHDTERSRICERLRPCSNVTAYMPYSVLRTHHRPSCCPAQLLRIAQHIHVRLVPSPIVNSLYYYLYCVYGCTCVCVYSDFC